MSKKKNILNYRSRFEHSLDEVEPYIFEWAAEFPHVAEDIFILQEMEKDPENRFPATWHTFMAGTRAVSFALTQEKQIKKFLARYRDIISDEAVEMLKYFQKHPMTWKAFMVEETIDTNLFKITDVLEEDDDLPLASKGVADILKQHQAEDILFIALCFNDGACLRTTGIIHSYLSVTDNDLDFICCSLDEDLYDEEGLTGIINSRYCSFFIIDQIAMIPPIGFRGLRSEIVWRELYLKGISQVQLPGKWDIETSSEGVIKLEYLGPDNEVEAMEPLGAQDPENPWEPAGLFPSCLYIIPEEETACIYASSAHDYALLMKVLSCRYPWKNLQQLFSFFLVSSSVWALVSSNPDFSPPWEWCTSLFEDDSSSSGDNESLDPINTLLREVFDAENFGREIDIPKRCGELGIDLEEFQSFLQALDEDHEKKFSKLDLSEDDKAYEIPGFNAPPPVIRQKFFEPLYDSDLFTVSETDETYDLFISLAGEENAEMTEPGDMGDYISELFEAGFGYSGRLVMNCLFYMMVLQEDQWTPVRSYGIEMLKMFHQTLLPKLQMDKESFLAHFSRFVLRILCTNGVLEISHRPKGEERSRGTYMVKSSAFFRSFITL